MDELPQKTPRPNYAYVERRCYRIVELTEGSGNDLCSPSACLAVLCSHYVHFVLVPSQLLNPDILRCQHWTPKLHMNKMRIQSSQENRLLTGDSPMGERYQRITSVHIWGARGQMRIYLTKTTIIQSKICIVGRAQKHQNVCSADFN